MSWFACGLFLPIVLDLQKTASHLQRVVLAGCWIGRCIRRLMDPESDGRSGRGFGWWVPIWIQKRCRLNIIVGFKYYMGIFPFEFTWRRMYTITSFNLFNPLADMCKLRKLAYPRHCRLLNRQMHCTERSLMDRQSDGRSGLGFGWWVWYRFGSKKDVGSILWASSKSFAFTWKSFHLNLLEGECTVHLTFSN